MCFLNFYKCSSFKSMSLCLNMAHDKTGEERFQNKVLRSPKCTKQPVDSIFLRHGRSENFRTLEEESKDLNLIQLHEECIKGTCRGHA